MRVSIHCYREPNIGMVCLGLQLRKVELNTRSTWVGKVQLRKSAPGR